VLIVAPATVINQWESELKVWMETALKIFLVTTSLSKKDKQKLLKSAYNCETEPTLKVVLASYEQIRSNSQLFNQRSFLYVILDEG
jgi:SNF2 family DNA or RNA helicase